MPSGQVHNRIWRISLPIVLIFNNTVLAFLSFYLKTPSPMAFIIGYFIGSVIEPDLDSYTVTKSESLMMKTFKIFGAFLVGFFMPYAYLFKHRGISHFPFVGTATRWLWLFLPIIAIWAIYDKWNNFNLFTQGWFWWMFLGNCFSDLLHIGADYKWKIFKVFMRKVTK